MWMKGHTWSLGGFSNAPTHLRSLSIDITLQTLFPLFRVAPWLAVVSTATSQQEDPGFDYDCGLFCVETACPRWFQFKDVQLLNLQTPSAPQPQHNRVVLHLPGCRWKNKAEVTPGNPQYTCTS